MKKTILFGVTSGIAAYKILDLIKILKNENYEIYVIMTKGAEKMFSLKDFERACGNKVYTDLFKNNFDYKTILKTKKVEHIDLAGRADIMVIAPATANIIGKLAHGIADDFLTTTVLATTSPIIICPSMNVNMWNNRFVQENIKKLKSAGYQIIKPAIGMLACGYKGAGRLEDIKVIKNEIIKQINKINLLKGKKIIITAGGTTEKIDNVRYITNRSSGKMGVALAEEYYLRGADVLLLRARNSVSPRYLINEKLFSTAEELTNLIKENIKNTYMFFQVAAVSDFKLNKPFNGKISSKKSLALEFVPQIKIINQIKLISPGTFLVAFKAVYGSEEKMLIKKGLEKMKETKADAVVVNDISRNDRGFESDNNEVLVILKNKKTKKISLSSKNEVAEKTAQFLHDNPSLLDK